MAETPEQQKKPTPIGTPLPPKPGGQTPEELLEKVLAEYRSILEARQKSPEEVAQLVEAARPAVAAYLEGDTALVEALPDAAAVKRALARVPEVALGKPARRLGEEFASRLLQLEQALQARQDLAPAVAEELLRRVQGRRSVVLSLPEEEGKAELERLFSQPNLVLLERQVQGELQQEEERRRLFERGTVEQQFSEAWASLLTRPLQVQLARATAPLEIAKLEKQLAELDALKETFRGAYLARIQEEEQRITDLSPQEARLRAAQAFSPERFILENKPAIQERAALDAEAIRTATDRAEKRQQIRVSHALEEFLDQSASFKLDEALGILDRFPDLSVDQVVGVAERLFRSQGNRPQADINELRRQAEAFRGTDLEFDERFALELARSNPQLSVGQVVSQAQRAFQRRQTELSAARRGRSQAELQQAFARQLPLAQQGQRNLPRGVEPVPVRAGAEQLSELLSEKEQRKEPVTLTQLRRAILGEEVAVPGARPFSSQEIGQMGGLPATVSQLLSSIGQQEGIFRLGEPARDVELAPERAQRVALRLFEALGQKQAGDIAFQEKAQLRGLRQGQKALEELERKRLEDELRQRESRRRPRVRFLV